MKVLLINGSPHASGSTFTALNEMKKVFEAEGIEDRKSTRLNSSHSH